MKSEVPTDVGLTADDIGQRLAEDASSVFHQNAALAVVQHGSDIADSGFIVENAARSMLDQRWQQLLQQLRTELAAVDSRIAHLRILMDLARTVR